MADKNKKEGGLLGSREVVSREPAVEAPRPADLEKEAAVEKITGTMEEKATENELPSAVSAPIMAATTPSALPKDEVLAQVEKILEEDLEELYFSLPPQAQKKFHDKGEETAGKILTMLSLAKINARKIWSLIRDWLRLIPGVNKFFLEQEAKIKADKIMLLAEKEKQK